MVQQQQHKTSIDESSNNIVAQSEYEAALAAIESTFDNFQVECENENLDQELVEEIYAAAKKSLLNNVKRVVQPINDNAYSDYVDQYHMVLDDDDEESGDDCSVKGENTGKGKQNTGEDEDEEEIDEEELVDQKAWKNARELRTRIRTMSAAVQIVRERVLNSTKEEISSSISTHLLEKPIRIVFDGERDENDTKGIVGSDALNDKENVVQNKNSTKSPALQESLKDLSKLLNDPQWARLPNRMQSLQETVESIQKDTTEDRVISQTEIAITSRHKDTIENSARQKILGHDSEQGGLLSSDSRINPMDRLALFGQIFS